MQHSENPVPAAALTVAAVARRLGVAPTTLRTWDRRYGLGPSARAAGAHRRYIPADVVRLEVMRRLVLSGVTPAEAARVALTDGPAAEVTAPASGADSIPPSALMSPEPTRYAGTGGRVLSIGRGTPRTRGLARAAMSLDAEAVTATLEQAFAEEGVVPTWDGLLRPLLVAVGERWANTGEGVDVEHLLSECTARALHRRPGPAGPPTNPRPVLLACAPLDRHVLPLLVLAAALAEAQIAARTLGAATPVAALATAIRRTGPAAVVLWAQLETTADLRMFDAVPRLRPPTTVIAGGQGWPEPLPNHVAYATGLQHGVELVATAVRG